MAAIPTARIHKLPDAVINQIAAGEVIERPVSVVKELLENSLDAGARQITIEVRGGGTRLIRVLDDGCGIHPDDLHIVVDRHTTNKLFRAADLARIGTLGFRGEALSSMASVSRMTLTTRQPGSQHGWIVTPAATSDAPVIKPAAHPVGTTVEVRDLFHNTPARRKFLRSERSEFLHIHELVKRIVLSRPDISLRLLHNNREVFYLPDSIIATEDRMRAVFGRHFADNCVYVQHKTGEFALSGWVGLPETARSHSDLQYFYLNGRSIRDKLVSHAVRLACQDKLYPGRQPSYLLYLSMDVESADVNVHPAKLEVRFRDPRSVHDFIYACLVKALTGTSTMDSNVLDQKQTWRITDFPEAYSLRNYKTQTMMPQDSNFGRPVLLVDQRYIVAEDQQGFIVVDSRRAREVIALARLRAARAQGAIRTRPVLVPLVMPVSGNEEELLDQNQALLAGLGLVLGHSAPSVIMVRELPLALVQSDAQALLKDIIATLKNRKKNDATLDVDLMKLIASHANDCPPATLTSTEMQDLLTELHGIRHQIDVDSFQSVCCKFDRRALQNLFKTKP